MLRNFTLRLLFSLGLTKINWSSLFVKNVHASPRELDEHLKKVIDRKFEKKIKEVFCRSDMSHIVYVNPVKKNLVFAMDNMNGGKEEIEILRKRLLDEAEKLHKIKIPLRWLVFMESHRGQN